MNSGNGSNAPSGVQRGDAEAVASYPGKRLLDVVAATVVLLVALPIMGVLCVLVWLTLGRPVVFRQVRAGLFGRPFTLFKFRTMRQALARDGRPLPDAKRLTRIGAALRRTSLDELPELWNVVRGDMSLVGPRPLLPEYLPHYTQRERLRFTAKPGITGLAQVSGRNLVRWDDRLEIDARYAETLSLSMDLVIILKTVGAVLTGAGAAADADSVETRLDHERGARRDGR
jgi:lipopolysaccharide/colanic/teichoic acid biosynthesis glycosyltransferase